MMKKSNLLLIAALAIMSLDSCKSDMDFYDTEGNIINSAAMKISVRFLSNKTMLTLTTNGQESASFLEQYFADNGIRLKVIEIL